jgi:hypothetical protein
VDKTSIYKYDEIMESRKWMNEIPDLSFPKSWKIRMLPPFGGAVVRFAVIKPSGKRISVYLDCYDNLGFMGHPYWEMYPGVSDDGPDRFLMNDTEDLLKALKKVR